MTRLSATDFLVLGDVEIVAVDKLKMEHDLVDQQVSKVGTAFLGMTLGCVRCHDHKFDPITQRDYYAIAGMFRSTDSTYKTDNGVWSSVNASEMPETPEQQAKRAQHQPHAGRGQPAGNCGTNPASTGTTNTAAPTPATVRTLQASSPPNATTASV